eukprot:Sdes_comp20442_c0_seq2m14615
MMRLRMKKSLMEASFFPKRFASSSSSASSSEANQSSSSARTWKYITFAGIPLILSSVYISFKGEHSHAERGNYPHMNIRRKPFPWGDGDTVLFPNEELGYKKAHFDGVEPESKPWKINALLARILPDPAKNQVSNLMHEICITEIGSSKIDIFFLHHDWFQELLEYSVKLADRQAELYKKKIAVARHVRSYPQIPPTNNYNEAIFL